MTGEVERAFVAALAPVVAPVPVCASFSSDVSSLDGGGVMVECANADSPVSRLWRATIVFRVDFPALVDVTDNAAIVGEIAGRVVDWLEDRGAVQEAFVADDMGLVPGWHVEYVGSRVDGDRLVSEVRIVAGVWRI